MANEDSSATKSRGRRILKPKKGATEATFVSHPFEHSPYHELIHELHEAAKRVETKMVDSTVDCSQYALCSAILSSLYRFLHACVYKIIFGESDETASLNAGLFRDQQLPTNQQLLQGREILIRTLLSRGHMLSHRTKLDGKDASSLDNIMKLILMSDALIFYSSPEKKRALEGYIAEDEDWIVENNMAIDTRNRLVDGTFDPSRTPVLSYRMSQFMSALKQISNHWRVIAWDDRLGVYLDLMRVRAGMLLVCSYDSVVHDISELCVGNETTDNPQGEYQVNAIFVGTVCDVFLDMLHDVANFNAHERLSAANARKYGALCENDDEWADLKDRLIGWVNRKIAGMVSTSGSQYNSKYLLKMDVRPGERSGYSREFTHRLAEDASVVQKYREVEFNDLCITKKRTFIDILKEDLIKPYAKQLKDTRPRLIRPELFPQEPAHVCLALLEMLESHMISNYYGIQWKDFWIARPDFSMRGRDLDVATWPIMLQTLNGWDVYYKGLIRLDSLIKALIVWLRIVEKILNGRLHTWDISPWIVDIVSRGGQDKKRKSLFKENDETHEGSTSDESSSSSSSSGSDTSSSSGSSGDTSDFSSDEGATGEGKLPDIALASVL